MEITTQLSLKDYRKWVMQTTARQPIGRVFIFMCFAVVFFVVMNGWEKAAPTLIFGLIAISILPLTVYTRTNKIYQATPKLKEKINYQFLDEKLVIKGESFESSHSWVSVFKVETGSGVLTIYETQYAAFFIPLRDIWQGDLLKLKEILDHNRVKNNLKAI